jgi:hypothetical protein
MHEKVSEFKVDVEVIAEMTVITPFDFFVEEYAERFPFQPGARFTFPVQDGLVWIPLRDYWLERVTFHCVVHLHPQVQLQ